MKIPKSVDIVVDVDVEVTEKDIRFIMEESENPVREVLINM